jgi:hypothetical protein
VRNHDAGSLTAITSWTPAQIKAMRHIVARIPAGSLHQRALTSLSVLQQAQQRAAALRAELHCSCLTSTGTDAFGPLPCTGPCSSTPATKGGPGIRPTPKSSRTPSGTGRHGTGSVTGTAPGATTSRTAVVPGSTPTRSNPGGNAPSPTKSILPSKSPIGGPTSPSVPVLPTLPPIGGHHGTGSGSGQSGTKLPIKVTSSCVSAGVGGIGVGVGNC